MPTFHGPTVAVAALRNFIIERTAALPDLLRESLREVLDVRSPVDATVQAVDLVYARDREFDDVPEEMREWAAAAATMAEDHGFHEFDVESRGGRISKSLRRQRIAKKDMPEPNEKAAERVRPAPEPTQGPVDPSQHSEPINNDAIIADSRAVKAADEA